MFSRNPSKLPPLNEIVELREPRLDYGRHLDRSFAVGIDVYKEPSANTIEVVDKALDRIEEIKTDPQLEGINLLIWENQGEAIRNSLSGLRNAGIYGGIMAVAVLHFFLRRFTLNNDIVNMFADNISNRLVFGKSGNPGCCRTSRSVT